MPTHLLEAISIDPGFQHTHEKLEKPLEVCIEELATLRFTIILTVKWEASAGDDTEYRDNLRVDLVSLRREYSRKIDEIAMTFSVQQAMDAKEEVERTVALPLGIDLSNTPAEDDDGRE
jgi:hypothetical protein